MDISSVISIGGMPGLYKVVGQTKNGVIVESLIDKKRIPAFNSNNKISALADISIYTTGEDMPLKEVLQKIYDKEKGGKAIDPKANDEKALREYMTTVLPEYDEERVHISDLRKLFNWYNLLHGSGLLEAEEKTGEDGKKIVDEKTKAPATRNEVQVKQQAKSNAPKVKAQGVRKSGTA